jgi:hypothetical protein
MIKVGLLATHTTAFAILQDLLAKKGTIVTLPHDHKLIKEANYGKLHPLFGKDNTAQYNKKPPQ